MIGKIIRIGGVSVGLCASVVLMLACSQTGGREEAGSIVVGTIQIVGNEPFTRVAIESASGQTYILKCQKEIEDLLRNNQGKLARVHFRGTERDSRGTAVSVLRAELLTK